MYFSFFELIESISVNVMDGFCLLNLTLTVSILIFLLVFQGKYNFKNLILMDWIR